VTLGGVKRHDEFWALRDVSFEVRRGDALGVIGVNGSGKSTLLKILTGAMYPTAGTYDVAGRVLSLLELGTGLNPLLTGRENVVQSAALLAFEPEYVQRKLPDVEAFAELGEFFEKPIRLYSSGMLVRLAFSLFACLEPDVFVVDEALSVGDVFFQQKCVQRIEQMRERGTSMLFVSHDLELV
jgi:lipopolysaccharide transport system ATP-binding protein